MITYNASSKVATAKNRGVGTVYLTQPETYKYEGASTHFSVTVNKLANPLGCKFDGEDGWTKEIHLEEYTTVAFSSKHSATPLKVDLYDGDSIAQYTPSNGKITASYNVGEAIWKVSQAESYKYFAADTMTCKVIVKVKDCPTCYVYEGYVDDRDKTVGETWNDNPTIAKWDEVGVAKTLTYSMAVNGLGNNAQRSVYVLGNWVNKTEIKTDGTRAAVFSSLDNYDNHSLDLDANTTQVKFEKQNTDNPYIKDIRVSRKQWFAIEDVNGNALSNVEMTTTLNNTITKKFRVNFSTCDKEIKIVSNNAKISVDVAKISLDATKGGSGTREITITYEGGNTFERIDAVITAYTKYENETLQVHAETTKDKQNIIWKTPDFDGNPVSLPVLYTSGDAASASTNLPITYSTTTPNIILISEQKDSFKIVGEGTGELTATQIGNDHYQSASSTKSIKTTNKKIQTIVWSQSFTRNLKPDSVCDLKAQVYITDLLAGTQEYSAERTAKLHYTCTGTAGVISINDNARTMRILDYGTTSITASVEDDDDTYEVATSVTKQVKVRQLSSGDCEGDTPIYEQGEEKIDIFYLEMSGSNLNTIGQTLAEPEVVKTINIDLSKGVPDSLKFQLRAEPFKIIKERLKGSVYVYQSTDNGITWSDALDSIINPTKEKTEVRAVPLNRNANMVKFVRPQGGEGHHYIEDAIVTRKQFVEAEDTIKLGKVYAGAIREDTIHVNYSDARKDFNITRGNAVTKNKLILGDDKMYVACGETDMQKLPFQFKPMEVGDWKDTVTIVDPNTNKSATVIVMATVLQGSPTLPAERIPSSRPSANRTR